MEHSLDIDEIVNLPEIILSWDDVIESFKCLPGNLNIKKVIEAKWEIYTPYEIKGAIQKEWELREKLNDAVISSRLSTSMFDLKINRQTIHLSPWPHHKYGNLYDFHTRNYLLEHLRLIGKRFRTSKILYCCDSYCSTSILEEKSKEGLSIDETIRYGINTFGNIPNTLTKAVYNYFFVDDFSLNLEDFPKDSFIFNRCNEEYFLEQKFGEQYIIKKR